MNINKNKLITEFFSTFLLIFTVLITKSTIYKIISIIFNISFFNRYYGANFNPLVSFINLTRGKISPRHFLLYVLVQGLGGITAYYILKKTKLYLI